MAKNNSQQQLSPETFIRRKAKDMPVMKCMVNSEWREIGYASVSIVREHESGNITFCEYQVDLNCRGIKDSAWYYDLPPSLWDDYVDDMKANSDYEFITYELAHNIIMAGVEYAEELGIMQHPIFNTVTKYFLEDDDDVPVIEIECGNDDGRPLFIEYQDDDPATTQRIVKRLTKRLGKDGFLFIKSDAFDDYEDEDEDDDDEDDDEFDDEDYDKEEEPLEEEEEEEEEDDEEDEDEAEDSYKKYAAQAERMTDIELASICNELRSKFKANKLSSKKRHTLTAATKELSTRKIDKDKAVSIYKDLKTTFPFKPVSLSDLPNCFFEGVPVNSYSTIADFFIETLFEIEEKPTAAPAAIKKYEKEVGKCPSLAYLELLDPDIPSDKYLDKLKAAYNKYPNFFIIKLQYEYVKKMTNPYSKNHGKDVANMLVKLASDYQKHKLTEIEVNDFVSKLIVNKLYFSAPPSLETCEALNMYIDDLDLTVYLYNKLMDEITQVRLRLLKQLKPS